MDRLKSTVENIDILFNYNKVKFDKLNILFNEVEVKEVIKSVNVYINIESIMSKIHNPYIEEALIIMTSEEVKELQFCLLSNILNFIGHYRRYFTKNKIKTNIVLYMNAYDKYTDQNNTMFNPYYRHNYIYDYTENSLYSILNSIFNNMVKVLTTITEYIENVYFVTPNRFESSLVPYLLHSTLDGQLNILVTRDEYDLQYALKKFLVVYPNGEETVLVTEHNLWEAIKAKKKIESDVNLPSYILPFILAIVGDKRRGIPKLKGNGWKTIYKNIVKLFDKLDITEDEIIPLERLMTIIKDKEKRETVISNFMCIDLDRQLNMVSEIQKIDLDTQLKDKYEVDALKNLSSKYFAKYPINIMELNQYSFKKIKLF